MAVKPRKFPAGSFKMIRLTSGSDEAMKAVEDAATQLGAASNQADASVAHSVLNTARERLAQRVMHLEQQCGMQGTVLRRFK